MLDTTGIRTIILDHHLGDTHRVKEASRVSGLCSPVLCGGWGSGVVVISFVVMKFN